MKIKLYACLVSVAGMLSCQKEELNNSSIISYGTSFGMCIDYCVRNLTVTNNAATFTKLKHGANPDPKTCSVSISAEEFKALKQLMEAADLTKQSEVIGCPDCADGGAEWVAINTDGKITKVTFEYNQAPEKLKPVVAKLKEITATFNDCK